MPKVTAVGFIRPVKIIRVESAPKPERVRIEYDPLIAWGYHAAFVVNRSQAYVSMFAEC